MCSPREVVPGSRDPGSGGLHRLLGRGAAVLIVSCTGTGIVGGCSSSISISCPSLRPCSAFCGQTGKESPRVP